MTRLKKPSGRPTALGQPRSAADYGRPLGRRPPAKTIRIFCEGTVTEPRYFEALIAVGRLRNARVRVYPGGGSKVTPKGLVAWAYAECQQLDWDWARDEAWCVFDVERAGTHRDLPQVMASAKRKRIMVAVSNPAFEFWFLLHYECTDRCFEDANDVIRALLSYLPNYEKTMGVFPHLRANTEHAIACAQHLREHAELDWEGCPNPSIGVDRLVSTIWRLMHPTPESSASTPEASIVESEEKHRHR